jgi:hypothetical protein
MDVQTGTIRKTTFARRGVNTTDVLRCNFRKRKSVAKPFEHFSSALHAQLFTKQQGKNTKCRRALYQSSNVSEDTSLVACLLSEATHLDEQLPHWLEAGHATSADDAVSGRVLQAPKGP